MSVLIRRFFAFRPPKGSRTYQVTLLGAANEIGQTVALLLRAQPLITKLVIHDCADIAAGVLMDVSHVPSESSITGYTGFETLEKALKNSDLVVAISGTIRKPGVTKKLCLSTNTVFIKTIAQKISKCVLMPFVGIATEPINSTVPMAAEIMRNHGNYDSRRLFGLTAIDAIRAQCIVAAENNLFPRRCFVPVIGGHSEKTIVPLLSQTWPKLDLSEKQVEELTQKIRNCNETVVKAKKGWSPTLSASFGILVFVRGMLEVLEGRTNKINAFIENNDFGTSYFSGLINVDKKGAGDMQRYPHMSLYESHLLEKSINQLRKDISKGKKTLELATERA